MNKKKALTFGEIMITLSILSLITIIIIPTMLNNVNERKFVTGCKKAYTTLSQATDAAILDRGPLKNWPDRDPDRDSERVYRFFSQHLNITQECINQNGCWTENIRGLNGEEVENFSNRGFGDNPISFKTADGMNMAFSLHQARNEWQGVNRDYNINNNPNNNSTMYAFHVDVNGDQGPNVVGKDIFNFVVTQEGLVPAGLRNRNTQDNGCNRNTDGMNCAIRVLGEGKMNYLHD